MNLTGRTRLVVGTMIASGAVALGIGGLGIGGLAHAGADDPAPEQGYVTIDESADPAPAPNTGPNTGSRQGAALDGDCPEKDGSGATTSPRGTPRDQGTPQEQTPQSTTPDVQGQA